MLKKRGRPKEDKAVNKMIDCMVVGHWWRTNKMIEYFGHRFSAIKHKVNTETEHFIESKREPANPMQHLYRRVR